METLTLTITNIISKTMVMKKSEYDDYVYESIHQKSLQNVYQSLNAKYKTNILWNHTLWQQRAWTKMQPCQIRDNFLSSTYMMTSSNGNNFRVTGPLCREFTVYRWIPLTKASDAELWYFLGSAPLINGWVNNGEAGDLRRHWAHYDVTVMSYEFHLCG